MPENNELKELKPPWNIPVGNIIPVPDELYPLMNYVLSQLQLHAKEGKDEGQTMVDITFFAENFFKKLYNKE